MSLTDRDRKILIVILPLVVRRGLLVPRARPQARGGRRGRRELTEQEQRRDAAAGQR